MKKALSLLAGLLFTLTPLAHGSQWKPIYSGIFTGQTAPVNWTSITTPTSPTLFRVTEFFEQMTTPASAETLDFYMQYDAPTGPQVFADVKAFGQAPYVPSQNITTFVAVPGEPLAFQVALTEGIPSGEYTLYFTVEQFVP